MEILYQKQENIQCCSAHADSPFYYSHEGLLEGQESTTWKTHLWRLALICSLTSLSGLNTSTSLSEERQSQLEAGEFISAIAVKHTRSVTKSFRCNEGSHCAEWEEEKTISKRWQAKPEGSSLEAGSICPHFNEWAEPVEFLKRMTQEQFRLGELVLSLQSS